MEIYISRRSLDYTNRQWICTYEDEYKMNKGKLLSRKSSDSTNTRWICTYEDEEKMLKGNLHFPKKVGLYKRAVDLNLSRRRKDAQCKFTFPEEV